MQKFERQLGPLLGLGMIMLTVAALYWGKPVLMPVALSLLLTFLFNPVVNALHRRGIGRTVAVFIVVISMFSLLATIAFAIGQQVTSLANELPEYRDNIRKKVADFREAGKGSAFERLQKVFKDIVGELNSEEDNSPRTATNSVTAPNVSGHEQKPVPVVVENDISSRRILPSALGPVMEIMATGGLVLVLVIFMLLRQQELRNRLIRVVGHSRLSTTTKAMDEAGERISRYLLMQSIVNATYGLAAATGFYIIGLPYVALWGFLAAMLRFIPYVGPWIGALAPTALSLAVFDDWLHPFFVIGLIAVLELLTNMIMEPLLYGQSAGVSEVALIVAVAFWTWVWGPVGLALATPLTVCIVVLCKYIPELEFIETLMGEEPRVDARILYYQRLLASDQDEAAEVIQEYLKNNSVEQSFDEVLMPALNLAKFDLSREKLTKEDQRFIFQVTRDIVDDLDAKRSAQESSNEQCAEKTSPPQFTKGLIFGCSASNEAGEIALTMLRRLLDSRCMELQILSGELLSSEIISSVAQKHPAIICISTMPPDPLAPTRYLCKRLRERFPEVKILVGRWGGSPATKENRDQLLTVGADCVTTSLSDAKNQIVHWAQILSQKESALPEDSRHLTAA